MSDLGAFVGHAPLGAYGPGGEGPLAGLRLGVKDLFDVAGLRTGGGTPAWLAGPGAEPALADAPAVATLRQAGARLVGKTLTDELAWSLNGENAHYGTPTNPAAPGRIPGGSSAGSAAAVAGGLCDIGLGTDTGGSIRLPASYCGLWGLRPSHGAVSLEATLPLAPSYDTAGWMTRDAETLARVGAVFFGAPPRFEPTEIRIAEDLFETVHPAHSDALRSAAERQAAALGGAAPVRLAPGGLEAWRDVFRIVQSAEVWRTHGAWVTAKEPRFGPGIAERFAMAKALSPAEIRGAEAARAEIAARVSEVVGDGLLLVPGAGAPPPPIGLAGPALDDIRGRALSILCPAGHAGLPQLALPAITTEDGPLGLGLIAGRGRDAALLALGQRLEAP